jgi:hypothetical protein
MAFGKYAAEHSFAPSDLHIVPLKVTAVPFRVVPKIIINAHTHGLEKKEAARFLSWLMMGTSPDECIASGALNR